MDAPALPAGHDTRPIAVGLSGGADSVALLHRLAAVPGIRERGLRALHVHHGLHADADRWAAHCRALCAALDIELAVIAVQVERDSGLGREGAARHARYAAFEAKLRAGEVLALAHHRDDQAETFLLRALRGSGVDGLGAMRPWRAFGRGWLWRPLLDTPRAELLAYAQAHALAWIEDPGNADDAFDRNFLRLRVLPLLRERWPQAEAAFARGAALQREAVELLDGEDARALAAVRTVDPQVLSADALRALPRTRRARVLRRWIAGLGLPPLPGEGVAQVEDALMDTRADADAAFAWSGTIVRRWRDLLHAETECAPLPDDWRTSWDGREPLLLPTGDTLVLAAGAPQGRDAGETGMSGRAHGALLQGVVVHGRRGGERIVLPRRTHSHALKRVLQDLGVPPWERHRLPLLSDGDGALLAAGDLAYSASFDAWLRERDARLFWRRRGNPM